MHFPLVSTSLKLIRRGILCSSWTAGGRVSQLHLKNVNLPEANKAVNLDLKKAAGTAFAAFTIGSSILSSPMANAFDAATPQPFTFSSTNIVAEKVVRQGLYNDYEVDIVQERDDARSTFKGAAETKSKKGKYTAILAILIVGSFIVPMAQYFWYVKDDDSSDRFFGTKGRLFPCLILLMISIYSLTLDPLPVFDLYSTLTEVAKPPPPPPKKKGWFN